MRFLLDTQAFIYAIGEGPQHKLPAKARRALLNPGNVRELSVLSISEIALKHRVIGWASPKINS
jgi:PIN domain nuclease of toxin-antitoxin system